MLECKGLINFDIMWSITEQAHGNMESYLFVNPLTPEIFLVILLTVCQTILIMLVWRIWYRIN